jgi:hypothetical protein
MDALCPSGKHACRKDTAQKQLYENLAEPNSGLGKAIKYLPNNWTKVRGVHMGDLFVILIPTARPAVVNPLDYLTYLLQNWRELEHSLDAYLPWNYGIADSWSLIPAYGIWSCVRAFPFTIDLLSTKIGTQLRWSQNLFAQARLPEGQGIFLQKLSILLYGSMDFSGLVFAGDIYNIKIFLLILFWH